ncbi:P-loop containing nucleoside triphosphate hydrolase protein [Mycena alexandri]|uniref:P-loop containing nucleoside triphosphate hydrolase protein n=1 Tax=Mycena alexandri TaxID=1745969 RepID=A0AAD6SQS1_9AGAR|nr:P-loop containing nucleoside triphosphate hydrolase protein [Mycena alexandri]
MASFFHPKLSGRDGSGIEFKNSASAGGLASSLLSLLYSFSALRVIAFAGALEGLRQTALFLYSKFIGFFWITAYFDENDESFDWMMIWLAKQPAWAQARDLDISTDTFVSGRDALMVPGEEEDGKLSLIDSCLLSYRPTSSLTVSIWYHRRYMTFTRILARTGRRCRMQETLKICVLARHNRVLNELMLEAKKEYQAAEGSSVRIYAADSDCDFLQVASRPKRKIDSVILEPGVSRLLVDDARDFLSSKAWYAARGIPFRRGYLLYGAPGSGKTSIITSIAGVLNLDVYIVSLSRTGLDDSKLSQLISNLPEQCIALMEDIDAAFVQNLNRDASQDDAGDDKPGAPPKPPTSSLSLSGLLNALDGVAAQEGRILYATTNKYHALDAALCRPGRMDVHVEFKLASKFQAEKLFYSFYLPVGDTDTSEEDDDLQGSSQFETSAHSIPETKPSVPQSDSVFAIEEPTFFGTSHRQRGPKLRPKQVSELAVRFSETIPEREVSMAALQGFLMGYKIRPYEAVDAAKRWVESEREARLKMAREVHGGR